ncbi:unnamed protein product, partial [Mesorhabditis spiculigera]
MLEINLNRTDFAQVGTTSRNCMRVIPVDKAELRKKGRGLDKASLCILFVQIVVGSQNGCIICICRKHNDTQIVYKTLPGPPIEAVCLGGALGTVQDKVFVAAENAVRGISKKGKQFFNFETNMAEHAKKMFIYGVDLVLCGKKSYNHYHDCVDTNYVLCNEEIHDVVVLTTEGAWGSRGFSAVLACNDSTIKVVEGSKVDYEIPINDIPYTLYLFNGDGGYNHQMVLYGTKGGRLGLVEVPAGSGNVLWEIETSSASPITCMTSYALSGNTVPDVIIGKEDGFVEQCDESITGLSCGRVSNEDVDEIIVCTFTGWLFSLSRQAFGAPAAPNEKGKLPPTQPIHVKVQQLKNELDELEAKVTEERNRYEELTRKGGKTTAFVPHFQVHDSFAFNNHYGCYVLCLELVIPIDYVVIQSEVPLKLIEADKNTAVISHTDPEGSGGWKIMATYRCQANTTRIELRIRVGDGLSGDLRVFVCPKIHPKMCQSRLYEIKPLATYGRSVVNGGTQLQVVYSRGSIEFLSDSMSAIAIIRENISEELTRRQIKAATRCQLDEKSVNHCLQLLHPKIAELHEIERRQKFIMALKELEANNEQINEWLCDEYKAMLKTQGAILEQARDEPIEDNYIIGVYEDLLIYRGVLNGYNARGRIPALHELLLRDYTLENVKEFFSIDKP